MIISRMNDNRSIYLSWRENGERKFSIEQIRPYFFVKEDHKEIESYQPSKYIKRDFEYERGDWVNLENEPLKKVYVEDSTDVYKAKKLFTQTYEADVPYHYRYCVDNLTEIPEYNMRKWYWDMEWQQGGEHDGCITTIVVYDNYDEMYYQWAWCPNDEFDLSAHTARGNNELYVYDNEKDMIKCFIDTMIEKDPDMLAAWFGLKFDLPKLLERCCALNVDPFRMSPINRIDDIKRMKNGFKYNLSEEGYGAVQQPLGGRLTLNLDLAFERQWNDAQRGQLPSLSLDYVSKTLFGEGKHAETKFEDPNEFYRRAWLEDSKAYLEYALVDVELLKRIDEENYTSEAMLALQRLIIAPFDACFYASKMGSIYFMRNADWKAPTKNKPKYRLCENCGTQNAMDKKTCTSCKESLRYKGAMVYDPLSEGTNGLHEGVAAFDFAQLYPSMMVARNISWETKSDVPTILAVNIDTPKDFSECTSEDMRYFRTDKLGLLPRAVLELKSLRNEYKRRMKVARDAGNKEETVKWNNNQMAVKRLSASFYGVLGFEGFGWADADMAASITASAREAIRAAAFKAKEM